MLARYLYLTTNRQQGTRAVLSKSFAYRGPVCMSFWYYASGSDRSEMQIIRGAATLFSTRGQAVFFF